MNTAHTLTHHSAEDYAHAKKNAGAKARARFEETIEKGRIHAAHVLEQIANQRPVDRLVQAAKVDFEAVEVGADARTGVPHFEVMVKSPQADLVASPLHRNAIGQLRERASMPAAYYNFLRTKGEWGNRLLADSLSEIVRNEGGQYLLRSVENEVRGWLSDRYRILDSRPLVEAFTSAAMEVGAIPIEGYALETKVALKAAIPMVFEPIPDEPMLVALHWGNSDFGNGAHELRLSITRLWCTNHATMDQAMKDVHVGRRLTTAVVLSEKTRLLESAATASAIGDVVRGLLAPAKVDVLLEAVRDAHEKKVSVREAETFIRKRLDLPKVEQDAVFEAFAAENTEMVPSGQSVWKLSNAISWVAGQSSDRERALDLERLAGTVLRKGLDAKPAPKEEAAAAAPAN
jgi:hypothetical protein